MNAAEKQAYKEAAIEVHRTKKCKSPTSASPGTREKVEVMAQRAERGETLFHPGDATIDPERQFRKPFVSEGNFKDCDWVYLDEVEYRDMADEEFYISLLD